jgi:hypothetical protein
MSELKESKTNNYISIVEQMEEKKWKKQFELLVKFKKKHLMLPNRKTDHSLFYWLVMQRKKAKNGELTKEQLKLYGEAGINILGRSQKDDEASLN